MLDSIININHIIDKLFASSKEIADDDNVLINNQIKIIISLNNQKPINKIDNIKYYIFDIEDNPNFDIIKYCNQIYDIIENSQDNKESENILIHCDAGVSRTGTILIFYLMKKYKYTYNKAFEFIKLKRPCIIPNQGFEFNLRLLELKNNQQNIYSISRTPSIYFIYYENLVTFLNDNIHNYCNIIIGLGNGMNYGNFTYKMNDTIDELLQFFPDIKNNIKLNNNQKIKGPNCIIYGTKYLIDMFKNLYYKTKYNMTNEELDKVNNGLNNTLNEFNIYEHNLKNIDNYTKTELIDLSCKLDKYVCKNDDEKNYKKKIILKLEDVLS